ncbi:MAG: AP2 domain-containing protein, partial [Planctomycetota bacterium]
LRPATHLQNSWNRRKQRQTSGSIYKGLVWDKRLNKWQVRIWVNRKRIYIGSFEDQIEAAKAYDKAAIKYYGEFANLNFET